MNAIPGIWKDGRIVPTQPINWPDGTPLRIEPIKLPSRATPEADLSGDDPTSIARRIAFYDALPPLRMSAAEEAEWREARRRMKDHTITKMEGRPIEGRP